MTCRRVWVAALTGALLSGAPALRAQQSGAELFQTKCAACHTLGTDRLVGPGLQGVTALRERAWLLRWISRPNEMIAAGDSIATRLLKEYDGLEMPNVGLTDAEAAAVVAYLETASPAAAGAGPMVAQATEEQILLGRELFQGTTRFANGGPSCTSCHDVTDAAITGGGVLARELTTASSRLGGPGLRYVIANPPFPVMQRAFRDHPLTEAEVTALVGFLGLVGAQQALHQPRGIGPRLFAAGAGGSVLLLVLYSLVWRRRLKGSVNQGIYDRQLKTT